MLEVRRLRLLRELSLHGTIAATARACSLTPSAVSQQLAALEREVRTPLFIRDGRRLVLTQAAQVLVEHAELILADLEAARAGVAALQTTVQGIVRLGAFPTAASALAAPAIASCRRRHPDLRLLLEERETPEALAALQSGDVDLALVYSYNLLPRLSHRGVELVPLATESMLAALPAEGDDPGGEGAPIDLAELADRPWVVPHSDTGLRSAMERACGLAGFSPAVDYTSNDYTVILALVQAGLGVSLVPQLALETVSADLRLRPVTRPGLTRTVSIALRRGTAADPTLTAVVAALREAADALHLPPTRSPGERPPS
jgi:DNA-binding transcriptional LysR family regulator